jgi:hypothetical protein
VAAERDAGGDEGRVEANAGAGKRELDV